MKIGIEVEGRLRGIKTLFMDYSESFLKAANILVEQGIGHVYISDPKNSLYFSEIANFFEKAHVTLDVTEVRSPCVANNISIMFRVDKCPQDKIYDSLINLRYNRDQIKVERDRHVLVFPINCAMTTDPEEFEGDVEV